MILKPTLYVSYAIAVGLGVIAFGFQTPSVHAETKAAVEVPVQSQVQTQLPHYYQCTGQLREITDNGLTLEKDQEVWQIARDPNTKLGNTVKVGDRVSVQYVVNAVAVDPKPEPSESAAKVEKKSKKSPPSAKKKSETKTAGH